jgi:hypothetical protein
MFRRDSDVPRGGGSRATCAQVGARIGPYEPRTGTDGARNPPISYPGGSWAQDVVLRVRSRDGAPSPPLEPNSP